MTPEVSIIIPAFNSAEYISETLQSIIAQSFVNWEALVIDDCSSDNTADVVKRYEKIDSRISYYRLDSNSGRPAIPRNYGIKRAKGRYIAFLDSDDLWFPSRLERQMEYFSRHPDVTLVFSDSINIVHKGDCIHRN